MRLKSAYVLCQVEQEVREHLLLRQVPRICDLRKMPLTENGLPSGANPF